MFARKKRAQAGNAPHAAHNPVSFPLKKLNFC